MVTRYDPAGIQAESEPGSGGRVLRNLLGIARVRDMALAESQALSLAQAQAVEIYSQDQRFSAKDICDLHRLWLGDIYAWAGQYRNVNMAKGGFPFAAAQQIPRLMREFERSELARYTPCRMKSGHEIAEGLAVVHGAGTRQAPLRHRHSGRDGQGLPATGGNVRKGYRPDLEERFFQWSISACAVAGCAAFDPAANGCRMPSMAEEDFADTHNADFALEADRRNGFDFESFIAKFCSRSSVDAGRMGSVSFSKPVHIIVPFPAAGAVDATSRILDQGLRPVGNSPAEAAAFIGEETARWQKVIRTANIRLE